MSWIAIKREEEHQQQAGKTFLHLAAKRRLLSRCLGHGRSGGSQIARVVEENGSSGGSC